MTVLVQALLSNVAIVAVLTVVVYAVTRIWRNPQLAHALWVLVLLKLVTPPLINVPLPACFLAADSRWPARRGADAVSAAPLASEHTLRAEPRRTAVSNSTSSVMGGPPSSVVAPLLESPNWMREWDWREWLLFAWGAGSLLFAGVGINRVRRFARLVAATEFANDEVQCDAGDLARHLGMHKSPAVRIVYGAIPPILWSIGFRTEILFPAALLAKLGREERRTILAHELAHVRRLDHCVRWLEALVVVLYWWNPIVWLVRRELNVVEEQCCDTWVVWLVPESRRTYASAILQTVEFLTASRAMMPVAVSGMGRSFPLKIRVAAILADPQAHRLSRPLRLAVITAALVGLPLSAVPSPTIDLQPPNGPSSVARNAPTPGADANSQAGSPPAISDTGIAVELGDKSPGAPAAQPADKNSSDARPVLRGRLFARGFLYEDDQLKGLAIATIDPVTGVWKRLIEDRDSFAVSPDGRTIVYAQEGALWNSDTSENPNPGKVYGEEGSVVFSPDSRSMLVTTWKRKPEKENEWEGTVWKMGIDGTNATPLAALGGAFVHDWSPDGQWLLVQRDQAIDLLRLDGKERRPLVKVAHHPRFSVDGKQVLYVRPWMGTIRSVGVDGANDKVLFQAPNLTFVVEARFSPDGKQVVAVLHDLQLGNDGKTPVLVADQKVTHPRIAVIDAAKGEPRILTLPRQDGWEFFPTGEIDWR